MQEQEQARIAIQALVDGTAEGPASGLNDWQGTYDELWGLYQGGGKEAVRRVVSGNRQLRTLLASGTQHQAQTIIAYPPLPAPATAVYDHLAPCGFWLDDYITFARKAAPMAPRNLHESAGLFAVSAAVARRVMVQASTEEIYPNLYTLFIAPSTLYTKSTGLNIVDKLLYRAGLSHLLLPQRATPQALVNDLCVQKLPGQQGVDLDKFLKRRAFAAQRSYIRDEVSSLFAEMRRDFNAGLLELILELYNCKPEVTEMTISRGDITIRDTYMSFLGVSTPSEMAAHLTNSAFWSNGLWARFALLSPDEPPRYAFYPQHSEGMGDLAARLRTIYNLFPEPAARLVSEEDDQGKPVSSIQVTNAQVATPAQLESGVWEAWRAYHKACHDMLQGNSVEEELHPNYGRFPGMVMKTAMVLAVMDSETLPIQIDLAHYARAQQIVESWRVSLHRIWKQQAETEDEINARRIYDYLKRTGGADSRALQQMLHIRARPVKEALEVLEESGQVEGIKTGRRVIWTAC